MSLHRIHGGLALAPPPHAAAPLPIRPCPLPHRLLLALAAADGSAVDCLVRPGQPVRRGEVLARARDAWGTALLAPASGLIAALQPGTAALPGAPSVPSLLLDCDGRDDTLLLPPLPDWAALDGQTLRRRLADAGIVGLGGGGFAAAAKLARPVRTLILNGAECEPHISCDEALLCTRAAEVAAGAALLAHIVAAHDVVIALEDRMHAAAAALRTVLAQWPGLRLALVPSRYPQGGERQLVRVVCGLDVPSGGYPPDIGVLVHNVATAAAAWRAVVHGEALTTRIVSVGGRGVAAPGNIEARLGTPLADLIATAGGYTAQAARLVIGGPLMGHALPHDAVGLTPACNAVLVLGEQDIRRSAPELPCIRCGECEHACPAQLQPQELLRLLRDGDRPGAAALGVADCIECGCCAFVCPSQIPLVDVYRAAKTELALARRQRAVADQARQRHVTRNERLAREQAEKVARVAARREAVQEQSPPDQRQLEQDRLEQDPQKQPAATQTAEAAVAPAAAPPRMDKSAVLAAIARGKARRAAAAEPPPVPPEETP
jgi:Na+-translocating ferredoxin:NAD+ oxidoreductase subunit C